MKLGGDVRLLWEKAPLQRLVLAQRHPKAMLRYDMADVRGVGGLGPIDMLVGGPPCNSACSANANARGLADTRALVLHDALEALREPGFVRLRALPAFGLGSRWLRPVKSTLVMLEYVPNILRIDDGEMWSAWLSWFEKHGLVPEVYHLGAHGYGGGSLRGRLCVLAQPVSWFRELGLVGAPPQLERTILLDSGKAC